MEIKKKRLTELYTLSSKHSNYQILHPKLNVLLEDCNFNIKSRYEAERLEYILQNVEVAKKTVLDIGGNTGYFSMAMLDYGAKLVCYFEGNSAHAEFVELASEILMFKDKIQINRKYFLFNESAFNVQYDITLLLNVLHHLGDDYGNPSISIENAKKQILKQLNSLAITSKVIVFQLGFNWKGNRNLALFKNGTKKELIDFVINGTRQNWEVFKIGIPELIDNKIRYKDLNKNNIHRQDNLGEFLNRPIFIMKSKFY